MMLASARQSDGRPVLILGITVEDWAKLARREAVFMPADMIEADTGIDVGVALFAGISEVEIQSAIIAAWRDNVDPNGGPADGAAR